MQYSWKITCADAIIADVSQAQSFLNWKVKNGTITKRLIATKMKDDYQTSTVDGAKGFARVHDDYYAIRDYEIDDYEDDEEEKEGLND